jgi:hypothetical protein
VGIVKRPEREMTSTCARRKSAVPTTVLQRPLPLLHYGNISTRCRLIFQSDIFRNRKTIQSIYFCFVDPH